MPAAEKTDIERFFPVKAELGRNDKLFLLGVLAFLRARGQPYTYLEIGSFLGGSLAPFLIDDLCTGVMSLDERGRCQPDERGAFFDYVDVTQAMMFANLHNHGVPTEKLSAIDGSVLVLPAHGPRYDVAFIDAEHTDTAVFRDFLYVRDVLKPDAMLMFHDSSLVFKGLSLILILLEKEGRPFRFFKRQDSEMSCLLFGDFIETELEAVLGPEELMEAYVARAEARVLKHLVDNRVQFSVNYTIAEKGTRLAYKEGSLPKSPGAATE